ncbi:MAG: molybdenum cofactor guanylyltransferase [Gemmatimonadota bacterium]|nr:MAG: molybdenum cofactor guanylyltransferase [Gemmatimonadota bacterium]
MSTAGGPRPPVLGVLLAGGQNRRYDGRPKALEEVGGRPIAARAIAALKGATDRVVLVANDAQLYAPLGLETRPDLRPGAGALAGIHTAVTWARELGFRGALVAACDMPFLVTGLLRLICEDAGEDEAVVPESESHRGLEPLCAFYGSACLPAIESALAGGDNRVIAFYPQVTVRRIPRVEIAAFGDPRLLFLNVNTPADRDLAEAAANRTEAGR